jgi:hypothetical protein
LHPCFSEREIQRAEQKQQHQQPPVPVISHAPIIYQSASTITAMQVRKEKEAELFANDQYWANRLKKQEDEFLKNNKIMEKEFNDTVRFYYFCIATCGLILFLFLF